MMMEMEILEKEKNEKLESEKLGNTHTKVTLYFYAAIKKNASWEGNVDFHSGVIPYRLKQ